MGLGFFKKKKLEFQQKKTERLNNKRLKLKAEYARKKAENKNRSEIAMYQKKLGKNERRLKAFGNRVVSNMKEKNTIYNSRTNNPYNFSSGSNPYDFSSKSNPYDFSEKKKEKKERGKTITIRL